MNGILNLYKEKGYTSFDCVAILRGIFREKKIGHAGTLDPDAEGVLICCLGHATKIIDHLVDTTKEYQTVMKLGITTDTQDMSGQIQTTSDVLCTEKEVIDACNAFVGEIKQLPPMYSAVHVDGHRLYELARKGKTVRREHRTCTIEQLSIISVDLPYVTFRVVCSKGTYIRTLCHDIGQKLQCGAAMQSLLRIRSGSFTMDHAKRLEEIRDMVEADRAQGGDGASLLMGVDDYYQAYPAYILTEKEFHYAINGNPFRPEGAVDEGMIVRLYDPRQRFFALYKMQSDKLVVEKMFL